MNTQRENLKLKLQSITENNYELKQNEKVMDLTKLMLQYIGDTDPILRDELICSTFCNWIAEKEYFSNEELIEISDIILDKNHLFFNIGNDEDTTVFTRTFSVLVIDVLLYRNRKSAFLNMDKFINLRDNVIKYYNEEKDLRGYLGDMGWAHGAAHGADALCELVQSKDIDEYSLLNILKALNKVLYNGKYLLSNEEDERMACVSFLVIMKDLLPKQAILDWIEELTRCSDSKYSREQYISRVNTKNFIRCLYFSLMHQKNKNDIVDFLFKAEEKLNKFLKVHEQLLNG